MSLAAHHRKRAGDRRVALWGRHGLSGCGPGQTSKCLCGFVEVTLSKEAQGVLHPCEVPAAAAPDVHGEGLCRVRAELGGERRPMCWVGSGAWGRCPGPGDHSPCDARLGVRWAGSTQPRFRGADGSTALQPSFGPARSNRDTLSGPRDDTWQHVFATGDAVAPRGWIGREGSSALRVRSGAAPRAGRNKGVEDRWRGSVAPEASSWDGCGFRRAAAKAGGSCSSSGRAACRLLPPRTRGLP